MMSKAHHGALILTILSGCTAAPEQQVWSSKGQHAATSSPSLPHRAQLPPPQLNSEIHVPVAPVPLGAEQLRESAIAILSQAARSSNPQLRANAIEALHGAPDHLGDAVRNGLGDENRGVRFAAAMTVGKLHLRDLVPLVEPLLHDDSKSVQAAAIYALRRCDRKVDPTPLAEMLLGDNAEVKGNAAYILGELGDQSAISMLRHAAGRGLIRATPARRKVVDLQIAEAMVKLGAYQEVDVIRAALFAPAEEGELVALACQMCGELNDAGALTNLIDLAARTGRRQQSAEVRLAAAGAVAQLDPSKTPLDVPLAYLSSPQPEIRAQAAHVLTRGALGSRSPRALDGLAKLLNDSNALVQVAAAGGILRSQRANWPTDG